MIDTTGFLDFLEETAGVGFFSGVPDSQLQSFCVELFHRYGEQNPRHIVAVNEGNAVALGAGYHLATGKIPLVYLQNSGLGNAVNPATSLTDPKVYHIPIFYLVGWRGEPGLHDEPQHKKQGEITCELLDLLGIPYLVVDKSSEINSFEVEFTQRLSPHLKSGDSVAIVVRKGAFTTPSSKFPFHEAHLGREEVIKLIADRTQEKDFIVSTTGKISRELFEHRKRVDSPYRGHDFLTVGSMGHSSAIALSIALQHPGKRIWCLDGDGAILMHMGSVGTIGTLRPKNFIHVVLNNASHESVGGMPTIAKAVDLTAVAKAAGYAEVYRIEDRNELIELLGKLEVPQEGPVFVEVVVASGSRVDLIRPDTTPVENKDAFMSGLAGDAT